MRESDLQSKCNNHAKDKLAGVVILRSSTEGCPDRMYLWCGTVFFVEFKATGKKARPLQIDFHSELEKNLFDTFVIDNLTDFKIVIQYKCTDVIKESDYDRLISPQPDEMAGEILDI